MTPDNRRPGLVVLALVLVLATMVGCGASQRQTALTGAYALAVASDAALQKYDQQHAHDIIAAAPDDATGKTQLATWRVTALKIQADIDAAIKTIAGAYALNTAPSEATALAAATALQQELAALGIKVP